MFPLVPNVVILESKEEPQPFEEVHIVVPWGERRLPQVTGGA